jgi:1,4-alpha-glucan branching enzyme
VKGVKKATLQEETAMALKKQYLKSKPLCKVTFRLPKEAVGDANRVALVGEFNDWSINATPMARLKDGAFKIVLELPSGREYQYRYLIDETTWENDWDADKYVRSEFGNCDNSVVAV